MKSARIENKNSLLSLFLFIKANIFFFISIFFISVFLLFFYFFIIYNKFEISYKIIIKNDTPQNYVNKSIFNLNEDRINWIYEEIYKSNYFFEIKNKKNKLITDAKINIYNILDPEPKGEDFKKQIFTRHLEIKLIGYNYDKNEFELEADKFISEIKNNLIQNLEARSQAITDFTRIKDYITTPNDESIRKKIELRIMQLKETYNFLKKNDLKNLDVISYLLDFDNFKFNKFASKKIINDIKNYDENYDLSSYENLILEKLKLIKRTNLEEIEDQIMLLENFKNNKEDEIYKEYYKYLNDYQKKYYYQQIKFLEQLDKEVSYLIKTSPPFYVLGPFSENNLNKIIIIINIFISSLMISLLIIILRFIYIK